MYIENMKSRNRLLNNRYHISRKFDVVSETINALVPGFIPAAMPLQQQQLARVIQRVDSSQISCNVG